MNLPYDELRVYRLAKTFGWTPAQIDEAPAVLCDWLLQIDSTYAQVAERKTGSAHGR